MKPAKTKAQIRSEIEKQISSFLVDGGAVNEIDRGTSGRGIGQNYANPFNNDGSQTQTRTPLTEQVKAIEERRGSKKIAPAPSRRPKKVLLKDDFGEPIRWVWQD